MKVAQMPDSENRLEVSTTRDDPQDAAAVIATLDLAGEDKARRVAGHEAAAATGPAE